MSKKLFKFNTSTIRFDYFRNMSLTAVLFMALLFVSTSLVFLYNSFLLKSDDSHNQLSYISDQLRYYLTSVDNYSKTIFSDSKVQNYMADYLKDDVTQQDTLDVRQQICQIIQSTPFIHSVRLYSSDGTFIVASESFTTPGDLIDPAEYTQWSVGVRTKVGSISEELKVLSYTRPFYSISTGSLLGYIEISIPESRISEIYSGRNGQQNIFMTDSQNTVQSTSGSPSLDGVFLYGDRIRDNSGSFFSGGSLIFYEYFPILDWYIISETPLGVFLHSIIPLLGVLLLIALMIAGSCIYVSRKVAHRVTSPLSRLAAHMHKVNEGHWEPVQIEPCNDEIFVLFESFNSMIVRQTKMRDDLLHAEQMKRQLSLSLLQEQVNPHFLYNTLDNICSLAELNEKDTLIHLTMSLSAFYRYSLSKGKMHVTVKDELDISRAYLEIMKIRYISKFDYTIECQENLKTCPCIKLLLQPVIENSIYHGIKELARRGYIAVRADTADGALRFTVEDNGKGLTESDFEKIRSGKSSHFGIKSIHNRIQLYYGPEYGLTIRNREGGGCVTVITIPLPEEETQWQSI
nr:sensor histidine kinase [uncultured Mediterraneibacter sp.]